MPPSTLTKRNGRGSTVTKGEAKMLFQRINRTDPEKIFIVAKNSYSTASLTAGMPVIWDYATDGDGVGVTIPTAQSGIAAAGITVGTIASGAYGLFQVYGYNADAIVDGGTDVAAGDDLTMNAAAFELYKKSTASTAVLDHSCGFALAAITAATAAATAIFVKCL